MNTEQKNTHVPPGEGEEWAKAAGAEILHVLQYGYHGGDMNAIDASAIILKHAPRPTAAQENDGVALISAERRRQVEREGWSPEHDDAHNEDEMAKAAACYAMPQRCREWAMKRSHMLLLALWPWDTKWWKPSEDRTRDLVKAGALIAAEIDRLQRAAIDAARKQGGAR